MESNTKLSNDKLFKIGVRLVKIAWGVEILAVSIGFLISIIVSFSVYAQLDTKDRPLDFGDYSNILVAALPFVLVAVVEASKIPMATALMYAKHTSWRILFFLVLIMLATITFETMLNGFERNFAGLNIAIDDRKDAALLLQNKIDALNHRKQDIDIIDPQKVDSNYQSNIQKANAAYYRSLEKEREYINHEIAKLSSNNQLIQQYQADINDLNKKESEIYDAWDTERNRLKTRYYGQLNNYVEGSESDKKKLQRELDQLKAEKKKALDDANFFTRPSVEKKYSKLISEKEDRLYKIDDRINGDKGFSKQNQNEQQLQAQLKALADDYQNRIRLGRARMAYLEEQIASQTKDMKTKRLNYRNGYNDFAKQASQNRNSVVSRAAKEKAKLLDQYDEIQVEVKAIDNEIYEIKQKQTLIKNEVNRLVNQNQFYRLAAYITNKKEAIDVPKSTVGLVALIWYSSLAFISAVTGVLLAIAGLYIQRIYAKNEDDDTSPRLPSSSVHNSAPNE
ncbi:Chromosome partition protein Smc [Marinomonas spartinae]|uniref:hypothetical protein n=1 Tax=Marinomonas spartinae TaxID=1792290 RepID=UPI000808C5C0|nr:hypothetical protein [Marinomonas spartinae]SBS29191.1 Chromosome partition protein Smc [Marinomonas spartinae]